jgi:hypothetical protein
MLVIASHCGEWRISAGCKSLVIAAVNHVCTRSLTYPLAERAVDSRLSFDRILGHFASIVKAAMSAPLFTGNTRRRPVINLGGQSGASAQGSVLERARAERREREERRQREKASTTIQVSPQLDSEGRVWSNRGLMLQPPRQAFFRSRRSARRTRAELAAQFDSFLPLSQSNIVVATRILALLSVTSPSDSRLAEWARFVVVSGNLFVPFKTTEAETWLVLVRLVGRVLASRVERDPTYVLCQRHSSGLWP